MNTIDLNGRRAIVTGGAQGLGRAIGERLQASGAEVYVWDFDPAAMSKAQADWPDKGPAGWIEVDVSNPDAVEAALRETQANAAGIDIVVNNAGISGPNMTTWEYPVRRVAASNRHRPHRPLPGVPCGGAADEGGWLGADRQHRLGGRQGRQPKRGLPTVRRRVASSRSPRASARSSQAPACWSTASRRRRWRPASSTR